MDDSPICREAGSIQRFHQNVQDLVLGTFILLVVAYIFLFIPIFGIVKFVMTLIWGEATGPNASPPSVDVLVYRIPADGSSPHAIRLPTTTRALVVAPDCFPSHIPDVWRFWNIEPDHDIRRDWELIQPRDRDWYCEGLYMTIYCFDDDLRQNHNVPYALEPHSRTYGDVFVAKLAHGQCGRHGWAKYEDIRPHFLHGVFGGTREKKKRF